MSMQASFVLLPGDGIGPEITAQARRVLDAVATQSGHQFEMSEYLIGGCAIDSCGDPLPQETIDACKSSTAVLLGAVGGPKWDDPRAKTRPEAGLLRIRRELGLFANLRPTKTWDELIDASPLKKEIVQGTDILFVRELTGGIYFGDSGRREHPSGEEAWNVMNYSTGEIERVVRLAAAAARGRRGRLTMVDKEFFLFPDVKYNVVLVDAMAMHLISRPRDFDVVVTANLFGDILTDEASMLPGSLGLLPSASIGSDGPGLFEPIHGSAPDIAGRGIANPLATILAAAMMLRYSAGLNAEADAVEAAVAKVLRAGHRTADIGGGDKSIGTEAMGSLVLEYLST
jgi:3-isopropylmalate dehydrogenase